MDRELESQEVEAESEGFFDEQIYDRLEEAAEEHEAEEIPDADGAALETATERGGQEGGSTVAAPGIDAKQDRQARRR